MYVLYILYMRTRMRARQQPPRVRQQPAAAAGGGAAAAAAAGGACCETMARGPVSGRRGARSQEPAGCPEGPGVRCPEEEAPWVQCPEGGARGQCPDVPRSRFARRPIGAEMTKSCKKRWTLNTAAQTDSELFA